MKRRLLLFSCTGLALMAGPALAQAPAAPTPATPTPAAPPPAREGAAPASEEAAPAPERLSVAKTGFLQPGVNLQVWAYGSHLDDGTDETWTSAFRARRAELRLKGEIVPKTFAYLVMFDAARLLDFQDRSVAVRGQEPAPTTPGTVSVAQPPSGGNTSILQDIQLTYLSPYVDVSIGQFKIPISLEGMGSASKLLFPERALVARRYGDRRDLGIKAEKKLDRFGYTLGLYSGEGQNRVDSNDQKDVALRLEVYPLVGVTVAVAGYVGVAERELPGTKDRVEGDLKVEMKDALVQAEYICGWDVGSDGTRREGQGFYVVAGYTFFDKLQPLFRLGSLDPEVGKDEHGATEPDPNDEVTSYELGVNYFFKSHDCKLQLAGGFFDPEQRVAKTRFDLTLAAQIAF